MIFGVILSVSGSVVHNSILVWFHINNTAAIITVAVAIIYILSFLIKLVYYHTIMVTVY